MQNWNEKKGGGEYKKINREKENRCDENSGAFLLPIKKFKEAKKKKIQNLGEKPQHFINR